MGKAKTSRTKIKVKDLFVDMGTKPQIEYEDPNLQIGVDFRTRFWRRRKKKFGYSLDMTSALMGGKLCFTIKGSKF